MDNRGTHRTPIWRNYALMSNCFAGVYPPSFFSIAPFARPFPMPDVAAAVSIRLVSSGGRYIGERGKAIGHNGPPRNLAAPHGTMDSGKTDKMGSRRNWRNPTSPDGTPRNTDRAVLTPQIHHCRVPNFAPLGPPPTTTTAATITPISSPIRR